MPGRRGGGAQQITVALAAHLGALGGEISTRVRVESIDDLPRARAVLCDVIPRQLLRMAGTHTVWAYCHVPNGSSFDMTERIENQIERFAPSFRARARAARAVARRP